nr:lateral signaling target protein 2 homolog [Penaeus vannamei]
MSNSCNILALQDIAITPHTRRQAEVHATAKGVASDTSLDTTRHKDIRGVTTTSENEVRTGCAQAIHNQASITVTASPATSAPPQQQHHHHQHQQQHHQHQQLHQQQQQQPLKSPKRPPPSNPVLPRERTAVSITLEKCSLSYNCEARVLNNST